jgi:hypothetical protein
MVFKGNIGPTGCPVSSVNNYQYALRNISEAQRPQLHCGGSLKSLKCLQP